MQKATRVFDLVLGVKRSGRLSPSNHPTFLVFFLLLLIPHSALAQSNAEWTQYKIKCGLPASLAYNDWNPTAMPCKTSTSSGATAPAVSGLTLQQQLAMQGAAQVGNALGVALSQWLFGTPAEPPAPPDPAELARQSSANQLNDSGIYLFKRKNYAGAINEFQKALTYTPGDQNIQHNLALAKQELKNVGIAGQTSDAIGQLLGTAPASSGTFGLGIVPPSSGANPNGSVLNSINLDTNANVVDQRDSTKSPVTPVTTKTDSATGSTPPADTTRTLQELDSVLGNGPDQELIRQIDQATGQNQAVDSKPPVQVGDVAAPKPVTTSSGNQPPISQTPGSIGSPDFDGSTNGNAALGSLHPAPAQSGVDLRGSGTMTVDPARVKQSPTSNSGSGAPATTGLSMRPSQAGSFSAPGSPVFDCAADAAAINRLVSALPAQQEAIRRTAVALQAALENAEHNSADAREKWILGTVKMLASMATSIASSSEKLMASEGALRSAGVSPNELARFKFLQKIKQIHVASDRLEGFGNSLLAGKAFGDTVLIQKAAHDLMDLIAEAGVLLVDSGIAEQGGQTLAAFWGPIGELGFGGVATGIDLLAATSGKFISAAQADQAALNLDVLRSQYRLIQDRIYDLQQELAQGCSKKAN